jgi:hypothetical protein
VLGWAALRDWCIAEVRSRQTWRVFVPISTESRRVLKQQEEFNVEEKRILDLLSRGLSEDFPNPQRVGCPDSAMLKGIALHKVPLAEADPWLDHFSSCSPCFQEFTQFRKQRLDRRRRTQMWLAAAAMVLLVVAGWLWVRTRPLGQTATAAVLDLRGRATMRGENPPASDQLPLEVPRKAKTLNLELPIGSNEGPYEVALLNPSGAELARASGTAKLEDHIVVLRADVDLAGVSPGSYFLGLRQPGLEWMRFPIRVL